MAEYGGVVRQSSGASGGGGGGSWDLGGNVMDWFSDVSERVAALPPEMLVLLVVAAMAGWFVLSRRTS